MDLVKVNDILEELAELVQEDKVPERLYLEICTQMRRQYTADNGPESDLEEEEPDEPSDRRQLVDIVVRERTVWSRREHAHQVYQARSAAAAAVVADMNRHHLEPQQPQQPQQRQGYVPPHLRVTAEDRARQAEEAMAEAVAVHRQIRAEREAARLARRQQRLRPPEGDHDHDQDNNNIVVLQDEINLRREHNLGVARLLQSSLLDPEPDTGEQMEQMEECD